MTAFEDFFENHWDRMLKEVPSRTDLFSNGENLRNASWDRKAAYLVWCASQADVYTYVPAHLNTADLATAPRCAMCGEKQYSTPSGMTCMNGHGGVPSREEPEPDDFDLL